MGFNPENEERDLEILESTSRPTEREVTFRILDAAGRSVLVPKEELSFRAELAVLLDEHTGNFHISHFIETQSEMLITAMQKRLASQGVYAEKAHIRQYLKRVSHVFKAKLARGEEISAIPFITKSRKAKGRPPKPRKRHHKRPVLHKGQLYESIADAAKDDPNTSYNTLKLAKWREMQKNTI